MSKSIMIFLTVGLFCFMTGCATPASQNRIPFRVTSDPSNCPVEVNGVHMGETPTIIYLGIAKHWVGLLYSPDGWGYGNEVYNVTCFPPTNTTAQLTSQTKVIAPGMTPQGADLFFNLRLQSVAPIKRIEVEKQEKTETTIKGLRPSQSATLPPAERLQELKDLKLKDLISEDEYEQKRKAIVDSL